MKLEKLQDTDKSFVIISNGNKRMHRKTRDISKEKGKRVNCGNLVRYGFRYAMFAIYVLD